MWIWEQAQGPLQGLGLTYDCASVDWLIESISVIKLIHIHLQSPAFPESKSMLG